MRTGTIFERSHVQLHKWLYAMYLVLTARKGISSLQLSKQIGVTQKTAWFLLGRIREACGSDLDQLRGMIEVDEAYVGGLERNKHASKKRNAGRGVAGKQAVLGIKERGGKSIAVPVEDTSKETLQGKIKECVAAGSTICTDEHRSYEGLAAAGYQHGSVKMSGPMICTSTALSRCGRCSSVACTGRGTTARASTWHGTSTRLRSV